MYHRLARRCFSWGLFSGDSRVFWPFIVVLEPSAPTSSLAGAVLAEEHLLTVFAPKADSHCRGLQSSEASAGE